MPTPGPPDYYAGNDKTFVPRCPEVKDHRLRRFVDVTAMVLNSLIRNGGIVRTGQADFDVLSPETTATSGENKDAVPLAVGMAAAVHSSGTGFVRADATTTTKDVVGVVSIAGDPGFVVGVETDGFVTQADWSGVTDEASTTLTPTARYFVSPTTPGNITATAPTTVGQVVMPVGRAITPTTLMVETGPSVLL